MKISLKINLNFKTLLASKKAKMILLGLIVTSLISGAVGGWLYYRTTTVEYALTNFNKAIVAKDLLALASLMNTQGVLTKVTEEIIPFLKKTPDAKEQQELQKHIGKLLTENFTSKEPEKPKADKKAKEGEGKNPNVISEPKNVFNILKTPAIPLPPDLLGNFKEKPFILHAKDKDLAVISSSIHHPQLNITLPIKLGMQKINGKWKVTEFANATQVGKMYTAAVNAETERALAEYDAANAKILDYINKHYFINNCKAKIFGPDHYGIIRLHIDLDGVNTGEEPLVTSAIFCTFKDKNNKTLTTLRLENTRRINQGEIFNHNWALNFETKRAEIDELLNAGEISCKAQAVAATIGVGKLLFPENWRELSGVKKDAK